ncbi:flagellar hook assembly protein FlgD [Methylopila sp. Yamaguchi]|uniref:flagellar hook assembly protein FlgD n=1 Tax=Methylopila sp. Yamaguchi TaxID=1437817 RepID=UPI000CAA51C5|nr:flagellar hook capping FlgD N-terminal domain-containing protein [Methylopila sp. Yamaguchi]GBD48258.1 flagellar hook capping protein [Methylopila sp. Yamaguchi]
MSITATSTSTSGSANTSVASSTLASNFDTFLTLLTTQLQNQNPLDPLDTNQFTQQLVQFAGVEQQLQSNTTLSAILNATQTAGSDTAVGLVGKTVTAAGDTAKLTNNKASWSLTSAEDDVTATVKIRNADGDLVATKTVALDKGTATFTWDGKQTDGSAAPAGDYTVTVSSVDSSGNGASVSTEVTGVVDGVDFSGDIPVLLIGSLSVPLSSVTKVKATTATNS